MSRTYFTETQHFDVVWIKLLMLLSSAGALVPLVIVSYKQLVLEEPWGQDAPSDFTMLYITIAMFIIVIGLNLLLFNSKIETKITSEGIAYRYWPFVYQWKLVSFDLIEELNLRKYSAWREFGGRGYKFRTFNRKGRSFTVRGDQGLQLNFKSGKKLLIGTQRPEEMQLALRKLKSNVIE